MSETEFIDLFPNSNATSKEAASDTPEYNLDEEVFNPGRSKINDYKHSSKTIQHGAGSGGNNFYGSQPPSSENKKYLNVSDERIVWAGAIFVFFGVFVFLVGYWLGKTSIKDISLINKQYQQKVEEKLDQKKLENNMILSAPVTGESPKIENVPAPSENDNKLNESKQLVSSPAVSPLNTANLPKENVLTAPQIQGAKSVEKNIKLHTASAKKGEVKLKTEKPGINGADYAIQVSAYTAMDKARSLEDILRKKGFQSYLVEADVNGVTYYRVRVGKFSGKEDALAALTKIKASEMGKNSFLMNLK